MGVRTNVEITLQLGNDNDLTAGNLVGDVGLQVLVDTIDKGGTIVGELSAGEIDVPIVIGSNIRLLYVEAEGDIDFYIGGVPATKAEVLAVGGTYPTSFAGGETLVLNIDSTVFTVTFLIGDQTLVQVINRINAAAALNGLSGFIASNHSGQLLLRSLTVGSSSVVAVSNSSTGLTALGLTAVTIVGVDPTSNASPMHLRRLADPASSQIETLKSFGLFTALTTSLYISNPSTTVPVRYKIVTAGDLSAIDC